VLVKFEDVIEMSRQEDYAIVEVKESLSIDPIAHARNITASFTTVSRNPFNLTVHVHRATHMTEPSFTELENLQGHEETSSPASSQSLDHHGYSPHRYHSVQELST